MRDHISHLELDEQQGVIVARLVGEIDASNAADLGRALGRQVPNSARGLVLDLGGVAYLDSAGIECLFGLARQLGDRRQRLRLSVPASSPVRRVLEICDIGAVAPLEESPELAAQRIGEAAF